MFEPLQNVCRRTRRDCRRSCAFSLVELTVSLSVLMIGLLGLMAAMQIHSRQVETAESWCRRPSTYYVVSQTNPWMRQLAAPADLNTQAGVAPWTPPTSGKQRYAVCLDAYSIDPTAESASASVQLSKAGK